MRVKLLIAGAGAVLLMGLGLGASAYASGLVHGPLLVAAQPSPSPRTNAACENFLKHLAANLGVSQSKLQGALQQSLDQTIDDAVKAGKLSAAQADRLKSRAAGHTACSFRPPFGHDRGMPGGRFGRVSQVVIQAAAQTLGITPQQLMQDVKNGQTLSSLAKGMTEDQFRQQLVAHAKTDMDALVKQNELTAAQEQNLLKMLQTAPIPYWNSTSPRLPFRPAPPIAPTPATATGA